MSFSCVAPPPRAPEPALLPAAAPSSATEARAVAPAPSVAPAVVLVVLDGVRWQEVFEGVDPELARQKGLDPREVVGARELMPTLHDVLIARGVAVGAPGHGPDMRATGPNYVSLPGYTEILTGRTATACRDNACPGTTAPTLADELALASRPDEGGAPAVIASWESLARAATFGGASVVVSAGRHAGRGMDRMRDDPDEAALLVDGERAAAWPGEADFRPDRFTADIALRHLETRAPRFLFLGLGEPDEFAHRDDYRGYLDSLRAADRTLSRIVEALGRMGERGDNTSIFVTTDHGRAGSFRDHGGFAPESGRVWLVASGSGIAEKGLLFSYAPHRLADIAPTMRVLLGLAPDEGEEAGRVLADALAR